MKKIIILLFLLCGYTFAQRMYCTMDSVPVYKDKDVKSEVLGYINKLDQVSAMKKTNYMGSITYEDLRLSEIFFWSQVKILDGMKGWTRSDKFVKKIYSQPMYNLWDFSPYDNADHVYNIGWSKDAKYYAYIVSGYIDGALDGLTVRFYVIETSTNEIKREITAYTSYETPIEDAWRDDYSSIQSALNEYRIIQDTAKTKLNPFPINSIKGYEMSLSFFVGDSLLVSGLFRGSSDLIVSRPLYVYDMNSFGWMYCPYDKNKFVFYTNANTGSSEFYVDAFAIDLKKFKPNPRNTDQEHMY